MRNVKKEIERQPRLHISAWYHTNYELDKARKFSLMCNARVDRMPVDASNALGYISYTCSNYHTNPYES